jgi:hypothetical protein
MKSVYKNSLFSLFLSCLFLFAKADEGMLIPSVISAFESDMKAKGMKLTAEQIYSINNASLKDAIIHFGGGCTAELVSEKGLLLTNHHCGYSQIQYHSSLEKDYLKNGFWAKTLADELPNPGLTATRIVRIDDVTSRVLAGTQSIQELDARQKAILANIKKIKGELVSGTGYSADIKAFDYGNSYYALITEVFTDVRLVGTPPNSIGKFGGDTDNWVWPRHTGDFSVFRIYASKDNKPAAYSTENVPYKPLQFLKIDASTREVGEFTMVYGFPGTTEQHLVSSHIKYIMSKERPARIGMREKSLSVIDAGMRSSDQIRIQYSAKQASIANAYKKWIGQVDGLVRLDAVEVKEAYEKSYNDKAKTNPDWNKKYGNLVDKMNALVQQGSQYDFAYAMTIEYLYVGPEFYKVARNIDDLVKNAAKYQTEGTLNDKIAKYKAGAEGFFKNYDAGIDQGIFELLHEEFAKQMGVAMLSPVVTKNNTAWWSKQIYSKSMLTNKERLFAFYDNFKTKSISIALKDPGYQLFNELWTTYEGKIQPGVSDFHTQMDDLLKLYVQGKQEMFPDAKHWPDANSTLRITYGKLEGSAPRDGMEYLEHTTIDGIIEKNQTGNPDFELLPRMHELYKAKDFGPYTQDGKLWVCFTGSNHTTGGNSGSPVLNAEGHLMGLNFDRSWESTMSDYMFDPTRCRNIVVDIRYVMWVIDKYSGAKHLVDEMVLVR